MEPKSTTYEVIAVACPDGTGGREYVAVSYQEPGRIRYLLPDGQSTTIEYLDPSSGGFYATPEQAQAAIDAYEQRRRQLGGVA